MIRPVKLSDAAEICDLYNYYIENTPTTFEDKPLQYIAMEERIRRISEKYPYLVREEDSGEINGIAYVNTWKERGAYKYSGELSIFVRNGFQGQGMGRQLMEQLLKDVRKANIHALIAGIVVPNERSVALHKKFGFTKVGQFNEIGYKFSRWLDLSYWELILK